MATSLSETQWYQGILSNLSRLDSLVRLDPQDFADDNLRAIEDRLADLVDAVEEGII